MLTKADIKYIYGLSPLQEGIFLHAATREDSEAYFIQNTYTITGSLDANALKESMGKLFERHDILRTVFIHKTTERPIQVVLKSRIPEIHMEDLSKYEDLIDEKIEEYKNHDRKQRFDLSKDPLIRLTLLKVAEGKFTLIWSHHHIILDGWCSVLLFNELMSLYQCYSKHQQPILPEAPSYRAYIQWLQQQNNEKAHTFWKEYLEGYEAHENFRKLKSPNGAYAKQTVGIQIDEETTIALQKIAAEMSMTISSVITIAWGILVAKYSNSNDVVFGRVVSGRPHNLSNVEQIMGLFINTVPCRIKFNDATTIQDLLEQAKSEWIATQPYHYAQLAEIQSLAMGGNPLDHILVVQTRPSLAGVATNDAKDVPEIALDHTFGYTDYDLNVLVYPGQQIEVVVDYNANAFTESFIQRLLQHFQQGFKMLATNPQARISTFAPLHDGESKKIISDFNATDHNFKSGSSIIQLFERQVLLCSDKVAVQHGDSSISYNELNHRSNQLAHLLISHGITTDAIVAICVERSIDLIVSMVAVLKTGAAYLPLDPAYPSDRLAYMVDDTSASLILTSKECCRLLETSSDSRVMVIDTLHAEIAKLPAENPNAVRTPDSLAYVIYTSGSTGKPKGVALSEDALLNLLLWHEEFVKSGKDARVLQFASINFDASFQEIFSALSFGGSVELIDEETRKDTKAMLDLISEREVNHLFIPFVVLKNLSEYATEASHFPRSLQAIFTAGEQLRLSESIRTLVNATRCRLLNYYGPSETHVVTSYEVKDTDFDNSLLPPIGKPIANSTAYILDKEQNLCGIGVPGDLHLGGVQVARGYINRPELTSQRFIVKEFRQGRPELLYKTGDLCKWSEDGNIDFLGRFDDQIKIRGNRVELDEVIHAINQFPGISKSTVLPKEDKSGNKILVAFIVMNEGVFDETAIYEFLSARLPNYMVPSLLVPLQSLPLNNNGKIDKRALLQMETGASERKLIIEPRNQTEGRLLQIWKEVLGVSDIGVTDNFFLSGGHSLLLFTLVARIHKEFNVRLTVTDLFKHNRVDILAKLILGSSTELPSRIPCLSQQESYQTSHAQKRLWLECQIPEHRLKYNLSHCYLISGKLNYLALEEAINAIVQRHEVFRTNFIFQDGELRQRISSHRRIALEVTTAAAMQDMEGAIQEFVSSPFALDNDSLLRVWVIQKSSEENILIMVTHHIVFDGASLNLFLQELIDVYAASTRQVPIQLAALPIQYKDYSHWQNTAIEGGMLSKHKRFWKEEFATIPEPLNYTTAPLQTKLAERGGRQTIIIDKRLHSSLKNTAASCEATVFMTVFSIVQLLIYRNTQRTDFVLGTPVANRDNADVEKLIGFFVNTVPIRCQIDRTQSFDNFLRKMKSHLVTCFEHAGYPFDFIVNDLGLAGGGAGPAIFNTMVVFQTHELASLQSRLPGIEISNLNVKETSANFDLTFFFEEGPDHLLLHLDYRSDVISDDRASRMLQQFVELSRSVANNPSEVVTKLNYLTAIERNYLLHELNNTAIDHRSDLSLLAWVEHRAQLHPHAPAVISEGKTTSYFDLIRHATSIAAHLQRYNDVQPGDIVAVSMERGHLWVACILAIWKLRAVYLPLDPTLPQERRETILGDSAAKVTLVLEKQNSAEVDVHDCLTNINTDLNTISPLSTDAAYAIFTSGSTGTPKGVVIRHKSISDRVLDHNTYLKNDENEIVLQFSSISFDASIIEVFMPLVAGGRVVIANQAVKTNTELLSRLIDEENVSLAIFPPSYLKLLLQYELRPLKKVISTGEAAVSSDALQLSQRMEFYNGYGPTETCIGASFYRVVEEEIEINRRTGSIPIGKPFGNTHIFVTNADLELMPWGGAGEIVISGVGVAFGYLNNPEGTIEKFVNNPFSSSSSETVLYRTGDLGRWNDLGQLEYLGRIDEQIQVRGIRVELREIERRILEIPEIIHTVVAQVSMDGLQVLCAYYTAKEIITEPEISNHLMKSLPGYMLPDFYLQLDKFPLTSSGKIDRNSLPLPSRKSNSILVEAEDDVEQAILDSWKSVLQLDSIGREDNFFKIGGHSLSGIRLISSIYKKLGVELNLRQLFNHSTVPRLAAEIRRLKKSNRDQIQPVVNSMGRYPLSLSQRRLWFLSEIPGAEKAYSINVCYQVSGNLNKTALNKALQQVVDEYEILRTNFKSEGGEPFQVIHPSVNFSLREIQWNNDDATAPDNVLRNLADEPFDLASGMLFRAALLQGENCSWLLLSMHHIISDGWSMEILFRKCVAYYNTMTGSTPREHHTPSIQYKDYAVWQHQQIDSGQLDKDKEYWMNIYASGIPRLELVPDFPRPTIKRYKGAQEAAQIPAELHHQLSSICIRHDCTEFNALMSTVALLLQKYSGQTELVVGTPAAGRTLPELDDQIGFFVNTLPLKITIEPEQSFLVLLKNVGELLLSAYEHQSYPFDQLVNVLNVPRDTGRAPVFDVMVTYQDLRALNDSADFKMSQVDLVPHELNERTSKFDLSFNFTRDAKTLHLEIQYDCEIFTKDRILNMHNDLSQLLKNVCEYPEERLSKHSYLSMEAFNRLYKIYNRLSESPFPRESTITSLFEDCYIKYSDRTALKYKENTLTYRELNMLSTKIARALQQQHAVVQGDLVGILIPRNQWMVPAILGVLKAGATYVPLDPDYPADRINFIIRDAGLKCILSDSGNATHSLQERPIDIHRLIVGGDDTEYLPRNSRPADAAYVIYTSGSTGVPKGVIVTHENVVRLLSNGHFPYTFTPEDQWLLFHSVCFDVSVWEMFGALFNGSCLHIATSDHVQNLESLIDVLVNERITILNQTPTVFANLCPLILRRTNLPDLCLRYIFFAGEPLRPATLGEFKKAYPQTTLVNMYGITETTVHSTFKIIAKEEITTGISNVGNILPTLTIFIIDETGALVGENVVGEIAVGGKAVTRGYLNRPELTAERFVKNPYDRSETLYLSGDLAYRNSKGDIIYVGRRDKQVKVRGYRIELQEIESVLNKLEAIKKSVVIAIPDSNGENNLIACYSSEHVLDKRDIRAYLQGALPPYMVPNSFVYVKDLPVTSNGKIDKTTLTSMISPLTETREAVLPRTETETIVSDIWKIVLELDSISVDDNFFEIGGHSLRATRVLSAIRERFNITIPVTQFFSHPTIEGLAAHIAIAQWNSAGNTSTFENNTAEIVI